MPVTDLDLFHEVVRSLARTPRTLPPKLLYDARGARLFEEITRLPEYYPTRTELGILEGCLPEVARRVGPRPRVVEFGSGSGEKTERLLAALDDPSELVLVDISADQLSRVAEGFRSRWPTVRVTAVAADYTLPWRLPEPEGRGADPGSPGGRTLFFFPGSTIGNFEPHEARGFLANMARAGGPNAALLLGVDRIKDPALLEPAYDDAAGVTAAFNRNALRHLNRRVGGDFDPDAFEHGAPWNPDRRRIEMHLVSRARQEVSLDPGVEGVEPFRFTLEAGEVIVTEHAYKYDPSDTEGLVRSAGWRIASGWTDAEGWFDVLLLER